MEHGKNENGNDGIARITLIIETLEKAVFLNGIKLALDSQKIKFSMKNGPLPTKTKIIELFAKKMAQFEQIMKVAEIFNMGLRSQEYQEWENLRESGPGLKR